jgi:hypothetical protein
MSDLLKNLKLNWRLNNLKILRGIENLRTWRSTMYMSAFWTKEWRDFQDHYYTRSGWFTLINIQWGTPKRSPLLWPPRWRNLVNCESFVEIQLMLTTLLRSSNNFLWSRDAKFQRLGQVGPLA